MALIGLSITVRSGQAMPQFNMDTPSASDENSFDGQMTDDFNDFQFDGGRASEDDTASAPPSPSTDSSASMFDGGEDSFDSSPNQSPRGSGESIPDLSGHGEGTGGDDSDGHDVHGGRLGGRGPSHGGSSLPPGISYGDGEAPPLAGGGSGDGQGRSFDFDIDGGFDAPSGRGRRGRPHQETGGESPSMASGMAEGRSPRPNMDEASAGQSGRFQFSVDDTDDESHSPPTHGKEKRGRSLPSSSSPHSSEPLTTTSPDIYESPSRPAWTGHRRRKPKTGSSSRPRSAEYRGQSKQSPSDFMSSANPSTESELPSPMSSSFDEATSSFDAHNYQTNQPGRSSAQPVIPPLSVSDIDNDPIMKHLDGVISGGSQSNPMGFGASTSSDLSNNGFEASNEANGARSYGSNNSPGDDQGQLSASLRQNSDVGFKYGGKEGEEDPRSAGMFGQQLHHLSPSPAIDALNTAGGVVGSGSGKNGFNSPFLPIALHGKSLSPAATAGKHQ